jgi:ribose transport system permease protein
VIGVLLLGTGNVALLISGGPTWTPSLFQGLVLIAAVALTSLDREAIRGWLPRRRAGGGEQPPSPELELSPEQQATRG